MINLSLPKRQSHLYYLVTGTIYQEIKSRPSPASLSVVSPLEIVFCEFEKEICTVVCLFCTKIIQIKNKKTLSPSQSYNFSFYPSTCAAAIADVVRERDAHQIWVEAMATKDPKVKASKRKYNRASRYFKWQIVRARSDHIDKIGEKIESSSF